jgi:hypothetical protein
MKITFLSHTYASQALCGADMMMISILIKNATHPKWTNFDL